VKLRQIVDAVELEVWTDPRRLDVEVTGGYASDLLSCVMAKAREGNLWVTLQSHPNIVAVASLHDLAGVIITEGQEPDPKTIEKADQEGVSIMTTGHTTYTTVARLAGLGVTGVE